MDELLASLVGNGIDGHSTVGGESGAEMDLGGEVMDSRNGD